VHGRHVPGVCPFRHDSSATNCPWQLNLMPCDPAGGHAGHERGDRRGDAAPLVHEEGRGQGAGQPEPAREAGDAVPVRHRGRSGEDPARRRADHGGEPGAHPADRDGRVPEAEE
jgi:hypothetical protein